MVHKEVINRELYVYMNGKLLYKRWLDLNYGVIFDIRPYNKHDILVRF